MKPSEMLQKFNQYYVEIEAIAQSKEWQDMCKAKHNDPEMKAHLGDVLHYLSETISCVEQTKVTCRDCDGEGRFVEVVPMLYSGNYIPDEKYHQCNDCDGVGSIECWEV